MIQERWHQLNMREKLFIGIGGVLVIVSLVFIYVWSPLSARVTVLSNQLVEQRELLTWMKGVSPRIKRLQSQGFSVEKSSGSLLNLINNEFSSAGVSRFISSTQSLNKKQVSVVFYQVPFDSLIQALTALWQKHNIDVEQFSAKIFPTVGMVSASVTLVKK